LRPPLQTELLANMTEPRWWQRYSPIPSPDANVAMLKRFIWLYVLLWVFEGALRKWIFPAYSSQLLLIRDPVALLILLYAIGQGVWRPNLWIMVLWLLGSVSFFITLALGVNIPVALIGLRTIALHFPLIFIMGEVLRRSDVERLGNIVLDLALPMGLLMVLQFASPPSSFVNTGAGVDSQQIEAVDGRIRAPGVFSFITGAAQYFSLAAAILFSRIVSRDKQSFWLLTGAAIGLVLAISMAISRTLTVSIGLVAAVFVIACLRTGIPLRKLVPAFTTIVLLAVILSFSETVRDGLNAFVLRWTMADRAEGSILTRVFSGYTISGDTISSAGVLGHGMGVGTNMGAKLLTGDVGFLLAEGEWERVVLEMGAPLGLAFILWRVLLGYSIGAKCIRALVRNDLLPLVIFAAAVPHILNGQSGVTTTLGFLVISAGMALAAAESQQVFEVRHGLFVQQRLPPPPRQRPLARRRA
jgi:hypothetical protein